MTMVRRSSHGVRLKISIGTTFEPRFAHTEGMDVEEREVEAREWWGQGGGNETEKKRFVGRWKQKTLFVQGSRERNICWLLP